MPTHDLPSRPNLEQYRKQAKELLKGWKASDPKTTRKLADAQHAVARDHGFDTWKKFTEEIGKRTGLSEKAATWKAAEDALVAGDDKTLVRLLREHEKMLRTEQPRSSWLGGLTPDYKDGDARTIIARNHFFESWKNFAEFAEQLKHASSPVSRFERAVDAVISGDAASLERELKESPDLVRARSTRTHHSTLLHYVGANGVESWRQRTPKNAVQIAEILFDAGSEIDATAEMYGGGCTTLGLVATSCHPRDAGLQQPLIDVLLARGASIDARGAGGGSNAGLIINSCLANGRPEAAEYLARRGAPLDLEGAAGIGRLDLVQAFFNPDGRLKPPATLAQLKDGFTWACEYGQTAVVEYLLDHGVAVGEVLPRPHKQTGLHWAALGGHVDTVKALLKHHPPLDVKDASFDASPLGWALYGWWERRNEAPARREPYYEVVALLVDAGSPVESEWLSKDNASAEPRMFAALTSAKS
jgi:Ankyrin repeats (3 copies)